MAREYELTDKDRLAIGVARVLKEDGTEGEALVLGDGASKEYRRQAVQVASYLTRDAAAAADPRLGLPLADPEFLEALHEHYPTFRGGASAGDEED